MRYICAGASCFALIKQVPRLRNIFVVLKEKIIHGRIQGIESRVSYKINLPSRMRAHGPVVF